MYSKTVMEHFMHPGNVGEIKNADGVGTVGNPVCGDLMTVYVQVKAGKIADIKFKTFGCAAALATSDMICDLAKGSTLEQAAELTRANVAGSLGGLPPIKMHCSNLAADALHEALYDYYKRAGLKIPATLAKEHEARKKTAHR
ncbi:iron-sulfur cluster assembly scaffold protein [Candidatus Micrarchaeota archaeon CG08_land_8_20_14_0_20_59_11]|nr:MAG: iron-sulfur cluster assembly scaffold protein [Candidatus Micrarchaeota archaeon CG08_land_8_20_14_0_20_59_11]